MRMQYGARRPVLDDHKVQRRLVGSFGLLITYDFAVLINQQNLISRERAFVDTTGTDRQPQWITAQNGAEVSTGAEHPAARVKVVAEFCEFSRGCGKSFHQ